MKYLSFLILIPTLVLVGGACQGPDGEVEEVSYEEDVYELIEEVDGDNLIKGSCNMISIGSNCVDFVGSIWTQDMMEMSCSGDGYEFSNLTCPYSDYGGCQSMPNTMSESIAWVYSYGGVAYSAEDAMYAQMTCDSLGVAQWVTPENMDAMRAQVAEELGE
ncbi:hypothetical protein HN358_03480 [Candidatus Uhrbacteria bacterium]|jgi:hypothetical protein|nr:hypothetical protein [Candidatus Uhrbacteria bacterium]MBT7716985.1 hypothetical protein [Candidatus Uhrbacteria bacterium]